MKKTVFIVEDEAEIALNNRDRLVALGYQVPEYAANVPQALVGAVKSRPDLVLLDIYLQNEKYGGIYVARVLKRAYNTPIVFLTAHNDAETMRRAKSTQPLEILEKPSIDDKITASVGNAVRQSQSASVDMEQQVDEGIADFHAWREKIQLLQEDDPKEASSILIKELERRGIGDDRIGHLLLLAEDNQFSPEQDEYLAPILLGIAVGISDRADADMTPFVHSAIRTYGSTIRVNQLGNLQVLLDPSIAVDSTLVVTKTIREVLASDPPERLDTNRPLADVLHGIGKAFLDIAVFRVDDNSTVAKSVILALASMTSSKVKSLITLVKMLNRPLFQKQLIRELSQLKMTWAEAATVNNEAISFVDETILDLQN